MARMADDAQPLHVRLGSSIHAQEKTSVSTSQDKTFKQAMASLSNAPCTLKVASLYLSLSCLRPRPRDSPRREGPWPWPARPGSVTTELASPPKAS